ncbi:polysaccharide biosynthesis tyrosine autokinase [Marinomonas agarivorans]|nr:polysaccharide biosynthesis tyrosine autokinase [Marinomonas agarivorans]
MRQRNQYGEIDVLQLLLIIWRKRVLVFVCTVLTGTLGTLHYFGTSDIYSAEVAIQVGIEKKNILSLEDLYSFGAKNNEYYGTQIELIKSRKLLEGVVNDLNLTAPVLDERPISSVQTWAYETYKAYLIKYLPYIKEYAPFLISYLVERPNDVKDNWSQTQVTKKLQEMVSAFHKSNSEFIVVTVKSYSPVLSTRIVNSIANTYIAYHFEARQTANAAASAWLMSELAIIKQDVMQAEQDLQDFSDTEDLVDIQGVMGLKAEELKELAKQQTELSQTIEERKIQYQTMINAKQPLDLLDTISIEPLSALDKAQTALSNAEADLLEISLKYGPKHPKHIFANENVENALAQLNEQISSFVKQKKVELLTEQEKLNKLQKQFDIVKNEVQQLTKLESQFLQKKREVAVHQELHDTLLKRLQESQIVGGLDQEFATVFDYALVDDSQTTSKRHILLVLSAVPGFIIGMLLSLFFGLLSQKIWTAEELKRFLDIPVLANLPKIRNKKNHSRKRPYYQFTQDRLYLESIHTLRTRLLANYNSARIISVTSAMPEEGKSTIALHLSEAFSDLEKVLIIDADLRRPSVTKMLGLSDNHPGLSDVLAREAKLSECIIRNSEQGFDILSAGQSLQNSNSLLSSTMMPKLLNSLTKYYDRIIIETAPLYLFSDAEAVSKLVDGVVFVVKAEETLKKDIKSGVEILDRIGANILGTILNQSSIAKNSHRYQSYSYINGSVKGRSNRLSKQLLLRKPS